MMYTNPFIVGRPIRESEHFVGRVAIKQTILGALSNMGSTCVIGERRTGKTSLLLEIQRQLRELSRALPFIGVYIDCSYTLTVTRFWKEFVSQLKLEAGGQLTRQIEALQSLGFSDLEAASDHIIKVVSSTHSIVMLLDEFDSVLENEEFAGEFLLRLRTYGSLHNVAYVTASRQRLEVHYTSPTPSPFFNIFVVSVLGLFPEHEAHSLLGKTLLDGSPVFNREEIEHVLRISGRHPFFLQLAAFILYTMKHVKTEGLVADWRADHIRQFETSARQHFEYYWEKSSTEGRRRLLSLAKGEGSLSESDEALKTLRERSLVAKVNGRIQPFSPIWADWILRYGTLEQETKKDISLREEEDQETYLKTTFDLDNVKQLDLLPEAERQSLERQFVDVEINLRLIEARKRQYVPSELPFQLERDEFILREDRRKIAKKLGLIKPQIDISRGDDIRIGTVQGSKGVAIGAGAKAIVYEWSDPTVHDRLDTIESLLESTREDVHAGFAAVYQRLEPGERDLLIEILKEVQQGRVEQAKATAMLDAIRRALKRAQVDWEKLPQELQRLIAVVEEDPEELTVEQKLELAIPLIPGLLSYKMQLTQDLQATLTNLWKDLAT